MLKSITVSVLLAGSVLAPIGTAVAATVMFSGTRQNVNVITPPGSGRCAPTYFNTVTIAPGNLSSTGTSNFGDFTSTQSHCIVTAPPTTVVDGIARYDFASGDALFATYTGTVALGTVAGTFIGTENFVATGGTGRFLDATGLWTTVGTLRFAQQDGRTVGIFDGVLEGTLNLPGVPEPGTWAMMIGGFGMVGGALRRRRLVASAA